MVKFQLILIAVLLVASKVQARPQDEEFEEDIEDEMIFAPVANMTTAAELTSPYCAQCLYDYKGNRVNKGCGSEKPPKCEKGKLVQTSVGEDYEMCCCNYSNFL